MYERLMAEMCMSAIAWGPGLVLCIIILYGLYRLINRVGLKIVVALEKPSGALEKQALSMEKLTSSLENFVSRDQFEHREIIILLKIISERIDRMGKEKTDGN